MVAMRLVVGSARKSWRGLAIPKQVDPGKGQACTSMLANHTEPCLASPPGQLLKDSKLHHQQQGHTW
jgi:hypothetical protein